MNHKLNELRRLTFKCDANIDDFVLQDWQNDSGFILGGEWLWALLRSNVSVSCGPFSYCVLAYCTVGVYI